MYDDRELDRLNNGANRGFRHALIDRWTNDGRFTQLPLELQAWLRSLSHDAARELLVLDDEESDELHPQGNWVNAGLATLRLLLDQNLAEIKNGVLEISPIGHACVTLVYSIENLMHHAEQVGRQPSQLLRDLLRDVRLISAVKLLGQCE